MDRPSLASRRIWPRSATRMDVLLDRVVVREAWVPRPTAVSSLAPAMQTLLRELQPASRVHLFPLLFSSLARDLAVARDAPPSVAYMWHESRKDELSAMLMERGVSLISLHYRAFSRRREEQENAVLSFCASRLAMVWRGKMVRRGLARCLRSLSVCSPRCTPCVTIVPFAWTGWLQRSGCET